MHLLGPRTRNQRALPFRPLGGQWVPRRGGGRSGATSRLGSQSGYQAELGERRCDEADEHHLWAYARREYSVEGRRDKARGYVGTRRLQGSSPRVASGNQELTRPPPENSAGSGKATKSDEGHRKGLTWESPIQLAS